MKVPSVMCIIHWCNILDVQVDSINKLEILLYVHVEVAYIHCISNKPPLVGQHAFPLTEFVGW